MINYYSEDIKSPKLPRQLLNKWIKSIASKYDRRVGELAYIFCSDTKILEVNKQYLNHDYYTDIITFDYCEGKHLSGDMFIGLETVASNATKYNVSFNDELYRVLIHGVLHLCGQGDQTLEEETQMRAKEEEALMLLQKMQNEIIA